MLEVARDDLVRLLSECHKLGRESIAHIESTGQELAVSASGQAMSCYGSTPCDGGRVKCSVVPGAISSFLASCGGAFAKVEHKNERLYVSCGTYSAMFPCVAGDGWTPPDVHGKGVLLVQGTDMLSGLYAMSTDEHRAALGVVLVDEGNVVTTDGHRLVIVRDDPGGDELTITGRIATRAAQCLKHDNVTIQNTQTQCVMRWRQQIWAQPLPQERFPDYKTLIPSDATPTTAVTAKEMASAVSSVLLLSSDGRVSFSFAGNELTIFATGSETGEAKAVIDCSGHEFGFTCNGRYMAAALADCETVAISQKDELAPIVVQCYDGEIAGRKNIIMPMRA